MYAGKNPKKIAPVAIVKTTTAVNVYSLTWVRRTRCHRPGKILRVTLLNIDFRNALRRREFELLALVLQLVQSIINTFFLHQLGMAADLADLAVMQDDDAVGAANRRQPVRDRQTSAAAHDFFQSVLDQRFGLGIDSRRGLVHDENFRLEDQHPRQR